MKRSHYEKRYNMKRVQHGKRSNMKGVQKRYNMKRIKLRMKRLQHEKNVQLERTATLI